MNYFIDTEFFENGPEHPIRLISIAIVCEDGRELYMENSDFDWSLVPDTEAGDWLRENIKPKLVMDTNPSAGYFAGCHRPRATILESIKAFITNPEASKFYGYFADYDWVLFCQLFGRMVDLPPGYPRYCRDLKQMMRERGLSEQWKDRMCPGPKDEHNALADARWNRELFEAIRIHDINANRFQP